MSIDICLEGKIALVTGARRGIGKAIATTLAKAGADIVVCDNVTDDGELQILAKDIRKLGRQALAIKADVSRQAEVRRMVGKVVDKFGTIDILVNNAGISGIMGYKTDDARWQAVLDVNLNGCYYCLMSVAELMVAKKSGSIINIASVDGIQGDFGASLVTSTVRKALAPNAPPFSSQPYNVSKSGVIMLTKTLARQLGRYGIRVNAIAPGAVNTDMIQFIFRIPEVVKRLEEQVPLGRAGEPQEIANVALFLASDLAAYVNGHVLVADGGLFA